MKSFLTAVFVALNACNAAAFSFPNKQHQQRSLKKVTRNILLPSKEQDTVSLLKPASLSLLAIASICQLAVTFSPLPAAAEIDVARGSEIFTGNCAGCHAGGMNFIKEKKNLKKEALEKFISPNLDRDEVKDWVMKSGQHQKLVFFKAPSGNGKLTDADFADVTGFIVDQAAGDK
mmetsp:Transcript_22400/g.33153  ORF Transcript_22400/g.33153 Transcript_22400/m.33153 type:complete len:175 (-) Transcript_22400:276-800(-)